MSVLFPSSVPPQVVSRNAAPSEWAKGQGIAWAKRNPATVAELDASYTERFGITRTALNAHMLEGLPLGTSILEVGCSRGTQLDALVEAGWTNVQGCDLSADAIALCKYPVRVADACDLPYGDAEFDLVLTSGTMMHVPYRMRSKLYGELTRVARKWVYGVEAWTPEPRRWEFGDLIPLAWSEDWRKSAWPEGWRLVRSKLLTPHPGQGTMQLLAFVMERS